MATRSNLNQETKRNKQNYKQQSQTLVYTSILYQLYTLYIAHIFKQKLYINVQVCIVLTSVYCIHVKFPFSSESNYIRRSQATELCSDLARPPYPASNSRESQ